MDIDAIVSSYVALRDQKAEIAERHKAEIAPYNQGLSDLEGLLMGALDKAGLQSAKTPHGTAYKNTVSSAKVIDWSTVLDFIIAEERFDLLEKRVNKTVVEEIGDVPGVSVDKVLKINVRRS